MLTAATGGSALAIFGMGMAGGANGLIIGGIFQKGVDSVTIAHELETKYGYNVAESQDIEVSELPESAQELCEQYQETIDDTETYLEAGTAAGLMGSVLFEAGMFLDSIDQTVTSASKNAYEKVKNWVSGAGKGGSGALDDAKYAQKTYSNTFSADGRKIYSDLVGEPINTIDDLVNAINNGKVNVADLPVEYIVRDGNTLILNTRTSQALTQAGIPRSQWNAINRTGDSLFEEMLTGQLSRNKLTSEGISTVRPSGGN